VTRTYPHLGDSGKLYHHNFCGNCGVEVMGMPEAAPEMLSIKTGSLDPEFTDISPLESEVYVTNRNAYIKPLDGLTQFDGMLPL
jgi:hypothetical protein